MLPRLQSGGLQRVLFQFAHAARVTGVSSFPSSTNDGQTFSCIHMARQADSDSIKRTDWGLRCFHPGHGIYQKEDAPAGEEKNPHNAEPQDIPGDSVDVAPGYFKEKDDDSKYFDTPRIPGPEKTHMGSGKMTGREDLPPGYLDNYQPLKPPKEPSAKELRQQAEVPDFSGGGAEDPRQAQARATGRMPPPEEGAGSATPKHPEPHPAGHSGVKAGDSSRAGGMPVTGGATAEQAGDHSVEKEKPLTKPVELDNKDEDPEPFEKYSRGNIKMGEKPEEPLDSRSKQTR